MQIVISSNPASLSSYLSGFDGPSGTVEAEYGETVVTGTHFTLAHHGPRSENPAPCLAESGSLPVVDLIGISHFDLDTLMGVGVAMGRSYDRKFAELVAFVDVNGAHKGPDHEVWDYWRPYIQAFWAWSTCHRLFPPKTGAVEDVTDFVEEALDVLDLLLFGNYSRDLLLLAGQAWAQEEEKLNESSLVRFFDEGLILRESVQFTNHLYRTPSGGVAKCVVAYNLQSKAITLSFDDPGLLTHPDLEGAPARTLVQRLWGSEAGGHAGIAGSPRDRSMTLEDAMELINIVFPYL
jgi:hypothetical protein